MHKDRVAKRSNPMLPLSRCFSNPLSASIVISEGFPPASHSLAWLFWVGVNSHSTGKFPMQGTYIPDWNFQIPQKSMYSFYGYCVAVPEWLRHVIIMTAIGLMESSLTSFKFSPACASDGMFRIHKAFGDTLDDKAFVDGNNKIKCP